MSGSAKQFGASVISDADPLQVIIRASTGANGQVTVDDNATLISSATQRMLLSIYNAGAVTVYIGFSDQLSVADGMPIAPDAERVVACEGPVYAVVDTGLTADVRWLEERF